MGPAPQFLGTTLAAENPELTIRQQLAAD